MAAFAHVLTLEGILKAIQEQVRLNRARMGTYELIDFVAVVNGSLVLPYLLWAGVRGDSSDNGSGICD